MNRSLPPTLLLLIGLGCGRDRYDALSDVDVPRMDANTADANTASGDAGTPVLDAARDVGALDAAPTRAEICGRATTLWCLDFERTPPSEWVTNESNGTLNLADPAGRTGQGMHASLRGGSQSGAGISTPFPSSVFGAGVYVSLYVRVSRPTDTDFTNLVQMTNFPRMPESKISLGMNTDGTLGMAVAPDSITPMVPIAFTEDAWVCVRIGTDGQGSMGAVTLGRTPTFDPNVLERLQIAALSGRDAAEVWYDDVVVSTVPVGCLP